MPPPPPLVVSGLASAAPGHRACAVYQVHVVLAGVQIGAACKWPGGTEGAVAHVDTGGFHLSVSSIGAALGENLNAHAQFEGLEVLLRQREAPGDERLDPDVVKLGLPLCRRASACVRGAARHACGGARAWHEQTAMYHVTACMRICLARMGRPFDICISRMGRPFDMCKPSCVA